MISAAVGIKMKQDAAKQSQFNNLINMVLSGKELDLKEGKFLADELYRKSSLEQDQFKSLMGLSLSGRELDLAERKFAVDQPYKQALTKQANAAAEKSRAEEVIEYSPVQVPGIGIITLDAWKSLPSEDKSYAIFYHKAKQLGDSDIMSKEEWEELEPTSKEQFLRAAMDDPELMDAAKDLARAGAMTLGELVQREGVKAGVKSKAYFTDPKGLVSDVQKHINSEDVQNKLFTYADDAKKRDIETIREAENYIRRKIASSGGEIVDEKLEERTFVFSVKWPDGDTSEVRYVN